MLKRFTGVLNNVTEKLDGLIEGIGEISLPIVARASLYRFLQDHNDELGLESVVEAEVDHNKEFYRILGLDPKCYDEEIQGAFRELAERVHPDKTDGTSEDFIHAKRAYDVLRDHEKRGVYDKIHGVKIGPYDATLSTQTFDWDNLQKTLKDLGLLALLDGSRIPISLVRILSVWNLLINKGDRDIPNNLRTSSGIVSTLVGQIGKSMIGRDSFYRGLGDPESANLILLGLIGSDILGRVALNSMSTDEYGRPEYNTLRDKIRNYSIGAMYTILEGMKMIPWYLLAEGYNWGYKSRDVKFTTKKPYDPKLLTSPD